MTVYIETSRPENEQGEPSSQPARLAEDANPVKYGVSKFEALFGRRPRCYRSPLRPVVVRAGRRPCRLVV
jgi:hypothetical protein